MKRGTIKEELYLENNRLTGHVDKGLNVSYFIAIFKASAPLPGDYQCRSTHAGTVKSYYYRIRFLFARRKLNFTDFAFPCIYREDVTARLVGLSTGRAWPRLS